MIHLQGFLFCLLPLTSIKIFASTACSPSTEINYTAKNHKLISGTLASLISFEMNSRWWISQSTNITKDSIIIISGTIIDEQTGEPLPYALIQHEGTSIANISNSLGQFSLSFVNDTSHNSIAISLLGYHTKSIAIASGNKNYKVLLRSSTDVLEEVVVTANSANQIMSSVMDSLAKNYPMQPYLYKAFLRSSQMENGKFVNLVEASVNIYDVGYGNDGVAETAQLNQLHATGQHNIEHDRENKLLRLLYSNIVRHRNTVAKSKNTTPPFLINKKLSYNLDSTTVYNNNLVYIISYGRMPERVYRFYVDAKSFAVIRAEVNENAGNSPLHPPHIWREKNEIQTRSLQYRTISEFRKYKNKWYLHYISRLHKLDEYNKVNGTTEKEIVQHTEMLVNYIATENVKPISKAEQMDALSLNKQVTAYDPYFWRNYNLIKLSPLQSEAFSQLQSAEMAEKTRKRRIKSIIICANRYCFTNFCMRLFPSRSCSTK